MSFHYSNMSAPHSSSSSSASSSSAVMSSMKHLPPTSVGVHPPPHSIIHTTMSHSIPGLPPSIAAQHLSAMSAAAAAAASGRGGPSSSATSGGHHSAPPTLPPGPPFFSFHPRDVRLDGPPQPPHPSTQGPPPAPPSGLNLHHSTLSSLHPSLSQMAVHHHAAMNAAAAAAAAAQQSHQQQSSQHHPHHSQQSSSSSDRDRFAHSSSSIHHSQPPQQQRIPISTMSSSIPSTASIAFSSSRPPSSSSGNPYLDHYQYLQSLQPSSTSSSVAGIHSHHHLSHPSSSQHGGHDEIGVGGNVPNKRPRLYINTDPHHHHLSSKPSLHQPLHIDTRVAHDIGLMMSLAGGDTSSSIAGVGSGNNSGNNSNNSGPHHQKKTVYTPQVEAISPTLPNEDSQAELSPFKATKDELYAKINRIDREIAETEAQIQKLKNKQQELEAASKASSVNDGVGTSGIETMMNHESTKQSVVQLIYSDNRKKAKASHAMFDGKINVSIPLGLPLYNQPWDTTIYHENREKFKKFKPKLMSYLRRRRDVDRQRDDYLTKTYDRLCREWREKVESKDSTSTKKSKDTKFRDFFEKKFPELRKQREDKERLSRAGQRIRSDAELDEVIDGLQEQEAEDRKMRSYAVIPPILQDKRTRRPIFINRNNLIDDPMSVYKDRSHVNVWSDSEKEIFRDKYLLQPKNFGFIASYLEKKSVMDCVQYYYLSKKSENYKQLLRKHVKKRTRALVKQQQQEQAAAAAAAQQKAAAAQAAAILAARQQQQQEKSSANTSTTTTTTTTTSTTTSSTVTSSVTTNTTTTSTAIENNVDNKSAKIAPFDCFVCKSRVEESNVSKSKPITRSNCQYFNLNPETIPSGARACLDCRFKFIRKLCPLPSCKSPDRKVKRLRSLPPKWFELSHELRVAYSNDLNVPIDAKKGCLRCILRIARKINAFPFAESPTSQLEGYGGVVGGGSVTSVHSRSFDSWSEEDINLFKIILKEHGKNWTLINETFKSRGKSLKECIKFYYRFKSKLERSPGTIDGTRGGPSAIIDTDSDNENWNDLSENDSDEETSSADETSGGNGTLTTDHSTSVISPTTNTMTTSATGVVVGGGVSVANAATTTSGEGIIGGGVDMSTGGRLQDLHRGLSTSQVSLKSDNDSSATMSADEDGRDRHDSVGQSDITVIGQSSHRSISPGVVIRDSRSGLFIPTASSSSPYSPSTNRPTGSLPEGLIAQRQQVPSFLINPNAPSTNNSLNRNRPSVLPPVPPPGLITVSGLPPTSGIAVSKEEPTCVRDLIYQAIEMSFSNSANKSTNSSNSINPPSSKPPSSSLTGSMSSSTSTIHPVSQQQRSNVVTSQPSSSRGGIPGTSSGPVSFLLPTHTSAGGPPTDHYLRGREQSPTPVLPYGLHPAHLGQPTTAHPSPPTHPMSLDRKELLHREQQIALAAIEREHRERFEREQQQHHRERIGAFEAVKSGSSRLQSPTPVIIRDDRGHASPFYPSTSHPSNLTRQQVEGLMMSYSLSGQSPHPSLIGHHIPSPHPPPSGHLSSLPPHIRPLTEPPPPPQPETDEVQDLSKKSSRDRSQTPTSRSTPKSDHRPVTTNRPYLYSPAILPRPAHSNTPIEHPSPLDLGRGRSERDVYSIAIGHDSRGTPIGLKPAHSNTDRPASVIGHPSQIPTSRTVVLTPVSSARSIGGPQGPPPPLINSSQSKLHSPSPPKQAHLISKPPPPGQSQSSFDPRRPMIGSITQGTPIILPGQIDPSMIPGVGPYGSRTYEALLRPPTSTPGGMVGIPPTSKDGAPGSITLGTPIHQDSLKRKSSDHGPPPKPSPSPAHHLPPPPHGMCDPIQLEQFYRQALSRRSPNPPPPGISSVVTSLPSSHLSSRDIYGKPTLQHGPPPPLHGIQPQIQPPPTPLSSKDILMSDFNTSRQMIARRSSSSDVKDPRDLVGAGTPGGPSRGRDSASPQVIGRVGSIYTPLSGAPPGLPPGHGAPPPGPMYTLSIVPGMDGRSVTPTSSGQIRQNVIQGWIPGRLPAGHPGGPPPPQSVIQTIKTISPREQTQRTDSPSQQRKSNIVGPSPIFNPALDNFQTLVNAAAAQQAIPVARDQDKLRQPPTYESQDSRRLLIQQHHGPPSRESPKSPHGGGGHSSSNDPDRQARDRIRQIFLTTSAEEQRQQAEHQRQIEQSQHLLPITSSPGHLPPTSSMIIPGLTKEQIERDLTARHRRQEEEDRRTKSPSVEPKVSDHYRPHPMLSGQHRHHVTVGGSGHHSSTIPISRESTFNEEASKLLSQSFQKDQPPTSVGTSISSGQLTTGHLIDAIITHQIGLSTTTKKENNESSRPSATPVSIPVSIPISTTSSISGGGSSQLTKSEDSDRKITTSISPPVVVAGRPPSRPSSQPPTTTSSSIVDKVDDVKQQQPPLKMPSPPSAPAVPPPALPKTPTPPVRPPSIQEQESLDRTPPALEISEDVDAPTTASEHNDNDRSSATSGDANDRPSSTGNGSADIPADKKSDENKQDS